jgi:hypothetical protein
MREQLHLTLGKLYDRLGDYDKAFEHVQRGNEQRACKFDMNEFVASIQALIDAYSPRFMATAPRSGITSERPVFIVGMPRSGTTLTEQILARHPDVYGAGELSNINRIPSLLGTLLGGNTIYPYNITGLTTEILNTLGRQYLDFLDTLDRSAKRVTDKMPHNFMAMGLIALLFPRARIVHCRRDPRDNCLSIYFQNFSDMHTYSNSLADIGLYYRHYEKLTAHFRRVVDIPILEFQYEELVADQEGMTRKLVEFAGLPWDERCLQFHEADRFVATPSYDQVSRPLYSSSTGRWKRYEKHLGPLLEALGMARAG